MEPDPFFDQMADQVARRLLGQVMQVIADQTDTVPLTKYTKEIKKWRDANEVLKASATDLAERNQKLEEQLAETEEEIAHLKGRLNEALIRTQRDQITIHDYPFREHMSEASFRELERFMRERPRVRGDS